MIIRSVIILYLLFSYHNLLAQNIVINSAISSATKDSIRSSAELLSEELSKSGYTRLTVNEERKITGQCIYLSVVENGAKRIVKGKGTTAATGPEFFSIVADGMQVAITANSALGVQHGIFGYLYSLGFRYYFPNPAWYIIPEKPSLFKKVNIISGPNFDHRRIWYGYGTGSTEADANYKFWFKANKLGGSMNAVIGHSYDDIVIRHREKFLQHPEWFYPVPPKGTLPPDPKFDLGNKELVQFILEDIFARLEAAKQKKTPLKMISLCPSDGMGTCNTPQCQKMGTITDRVYTLINTAARAVNANYPGTWISGMAYSEYSAPPTKKLEPNTFVSIATAFNYSKFTIEELIEGWAKKAGKVGVYDYLGLYVWDFDLPGKGLASNINKTVSGLRRYYRLGARTYDAETTPGSINKGLGHYIVSRLLWDIDADTTAIRKEFFQNCFGKSAGIMKNLWTEWEYYPYDQVRESDLASWIDMVAEAGTKEKNAQVAARLDQVKTYLHYLYLYDNYRKTGNETDVLNLLTYCYNTMPVGSVSGYPALFEIGNRTPVPGMTFDDQKAKYKKIDPLLSKPENINALITADRKKLQLKDKVKAVPLSMGFQKATLSPVFTGKKYDRFKNATNMSGIHYFVFEIKEPGVKNFFKISGGYVEGGGSQAPITATVTNYTGTITDDQAPIIQYDYTSRSRDTQQVSFSKLKKGFYLLKILDPVKMFRISFSPVVSYSLIATPDHRFNGYSTYLSFFVPKGTKKFRVFKQIETILISANGRVVDLSKKGSAEIDVEVMPGEEGLWMINFLNGQMHIEGIPPYLGIEPSQMLIPKDLK